MAAAMKEAADLRAAGSGVLLVWANKNKKFQKEQLTKAGYDEFREYFAIISAMISVLPLEMFLTE